MSYIPPPSVNQVWMQPWAADPKFYEVAQEQWRSEEAMWRYGELAALVSMWSVKDYEAGECKLCPTCNLGDPAVQSVYKQPAYEKCPTCYGALYVGPHGGVKAFLVKPSIWTWGEENTAWGRRGETERQEGNVTFPGSSFLQVRDYIFRGDGYRFQVTNWSGTHLATGFMTQSHTQTAVSYVAQVAREEPTTSPAYLIPPDQPTLISLLNQPYLRFPPEALWPPSLIGPQY